MRPSLLEVSAPSPPGGRAGWRGAFGVHMSLLSRAWALESLRVTACPDPSAPRRQASRLALASGAGP